MKRWVLVCALVFFFSSSLVMAATETVEYGTPIVFTDTGGDVVFDVTGLANGVGRISARKDLGAVRDRAAELRCTFQGDSAMVAGAAVEIYLAWSDGTNPDGELGTADAALVTDKRLNLDRAMTLFVDQTATDTNMTASTEITLQSRYVQTGMWNASGVTSEAGAGTTKCTIIPLVRKIS